MKRISSAAAPALALAVIVLAGCPQPAPRPAPAEPPPSAEKAPAAEEAIPFVRQAVGDVDRLMGYYGYLSTLSAERLVQEHERTLRFYRQQYSDFTLMQLVLQRIMPQAPFRDSAQAQEMLSSFLKEPRTQTSELRPVALLLSTMLTEQQQKEAEVQAQAQKVKEETRRYEEVKQKLDAIVDTERKMLQRNKPARKP
jgi:hypothetical protein